MDSLPQESEEQKQIRLDAAQKIQDHPEKFFFCEACGNLFNRGGAVDHSGMCPMCHGYRFNYNPRDIVSQAIHLGSKPRSSVIPADFKR